MSSEWHVRREICDIGRRIYERHFAAGNDGNISQRLSEDRVICTPTMICKGFMKPDDLCIVDMAGNQLSGKRKRTSEVLLHLEIYRSDPGVRAVVHCHPPHATAFGVARVDVPSCVLPEVEVFLGVVPRAEYETPGDARFAETIRPFIGKATSVILSNHGTVSWGPSVERAYWNTEILDAYCRILLLARQLGHIERLPGAKVRELLELRKHFGAPPDPRQGTDAALCVNTAFGDGEEASESAAAGAVAAHDRETLVRLIAEEVLAALTRSES